MVGEGGKGVVRFSSSGEVVEGVDSEGLGLMWLKGGRGKEMGDVVGMATA